MDSNEQQPSEGDWDDADESATDLEERLDLAFAREEDGARGWCFDGVEFVLLRRCFGEWVDGDGHRMSCVVVFDSLEDAFRNARCRWDESALLPKMIRSAIKNQHMF